MTTGQAKEYAIDRFREHVQRFYRLADAAKRARISQSQANYCRELYELDKVFPDLDYRLFRNREGLATA